MSNSSAVAQQIARSLVQAGVSDVVFAPGSRSAPLVYALAPLAEAGLIRTHVRVDERDAAFLALGLARGLRARGSESAVAVVTTSGSAVANLHPAVLEASYGHLPLLALTADRPARLRGTGANQTIDDQSQVLSDVRARFDVPAGDTAEAVHRAMSDAVAATLGSRSDTATEAAGPVHFNVQFDTPLVPTPEELDTWKSEIKGLAETRVAKAEPRIDIGAGNDSQTSVEVTITEGTVIVAGDAGGHSAESLRALAEVHRLPVLAEPSSPLARTAVDSKESSTSGSSEPSTVVPAHARVLSEHPELREAIRTVIVHGKPTLTRPVAALLADDTVTVQRIPDAVDAFDLTVRDERTVADDGRAAGETQGAAASGLTWVRAWTDAGSSLVAAARTERSAERSPEPSTGENPGAASARDFQVTARAVTEQLATQDITLFVASSNSVRYLSDATDIRARIHASRGLAGIDGLISTTTGLSLGLGEPVVLLIGDIAMLHDIGGLLTPSHEDAGDVTIVVLNDDGGAIFSGLEHSQPHLEGFLERYFTVPHGRGFADLAAGYGWDHEQVTSAEEFETALGTIDGQRNAGVRRIIEVTEPR
ncbi:2-succinyl-5-enolpyruvyl-6-hydroxy-3-cyclohexene-1-carboxylic-acid synthase [Brevibacterium sp. JSBI002]|uniref:2-succinyl-5-enolpyruvyl-6-hydroxy-3- cyclohexene-1-carboxylic-acid synthase n=1 Tax=Brevibacterium sp. JSBI002 TaxID=2886045 RepID=UPI00222FB1B4|nr:2-succinyl-5-enolpyruvyl-6-hydroxy-3-cyclohexene-1-carboxylic-acid synthase [Brevibacterium sp. JSBI002]UZD63121.1 2-succinyl-5-enolpyruvyl-6-hydroxy-3-cyclohexene-1-carboxylic-acid synthase [Brevibacterium sp. JSBI002]